MKLLFLGKSLFDSMICQTEVKDGIKTLVYTGRELPSYGKYLAGGPNGHFKLEIYSGSMSDESETSLICFDVNGSNVEASKSGFSAVVGDDGLTITLGISNVGSVATDTNVATWFKYYNVRDPGMFVIGSVGRIGSDADLLLSDIQIVKGQNYKCFGFKVLLNSKLYILGT